MIQNLYTLPITNLADVYGGGTYNESSYNASGTTTTTTTNDSTLVNTGVYIIGFVTVASLIILAAIAVRILHRKKQIKPSQSE